MFITFEGPRQVDARPRRDTIVVLDYGSQYTQLIVRRVRECHVYCESVPWDAPPATIRALAPSGLILSGGPSSVYDEGAPGLPTHVLTWGVPVLGICYGMQLLAHVLGGSVVRAEAREYGLSRLTVSESAGPLLAPMGEGADVWMSHGDRIQNLPPGFRTLAQSDNSPYGAMGDDARRIYGLQFHPEVAHTSGGRQVLRAFCIDICGCAGDWTPGAFVEEAVVAIRREVGQGRVICAVSGGVDSTVVATLVHRAVGDQLTAVFVDTGLLRQDEAEENMDLFERHLGGSVVYVDARARFFARLAGVSDPEEKRIRIGREFVAVFEEQAAQVGGASHLAQGTLYPDVIESAQNAQSAVKIKTHHNVGGLPETMRLRLIEPLRNLYKDEVRDVGLALGLPEEMVYRQPFPGPGLAVRILGEVTPERVRVLQAADRIVRDEVARAGLQREIWQYFAVLTPLRSVGVMGDNRTYAHMAAIRAVTSEDGMTADWARLPLQVLARMSTRIVNEIPEINRVVYDISSKPPATIEWE